MIVCIRHTLKNINILWYHPPQRRSLVQYQTPQPFEISRSTAVMSTFGTRALGAPATPAASATSAFGSPEPGFGQPTSGQTSFGEGSTTMSAAPAATAPTSAFGQPELVQSAFRTIAQPPRGEGTIVFGTFVTSTTTSPPATGAGASGGPTWRREMWGAVKEDKERMDESIDPYDGGKTAPASDRLRTELVTAISISAYFALAPADGLVDELDELSDFRKGCHARRDGLRSRAGGNQEQLTSGEAWKVGEWLEGPLQGAG
ncbi:hypothetical protein BKA70DRAFT_1218627 [Coprinopsis sp. MPI-PUGE-AT-0042]|nr:hypothetical protein BKA70DRAFT_1218627 [Coprinopsis sp. MPI-PUGE-AT-0042]